MKKSLEEKHIILTHTHMYIYIYCNRNLNHPTFYFISPQRFPPKKDITSPNAILSHCLLVRQGAGIKALSLGASTFSCTAPMRSISPGAAGTMAIPAASRRRTRRDLRGGEMGGSWGKLGKVGRSGGVSDAFRWFQMVLMQMRKEQQL